MQMELDAATPSSRPRCGILVNMLLGALVLMSPSAPCFGQVKVASIKGWDWGATAMTDLDQNWHVYGTVPLQIDKTLHEVPSFTYEDLAATDADVLWLSNSAGGLAQFSEAEVAAIDRYVSEGHSILGTYKVFAHNAYDNRALMPTFGLPIMPLALLDTDADGEPTTAAYNILAPGPLFHAVPNPHQSSGYRFSQATASTWASEGLGDAQLVAQTDDGHGIITLYQTPAYNAIYISTMPEHYGNTKDVQLLYNALTMPVPEPATLSLLALGAVAALRRRGR